MAHLAHLAHPPKPALSNTALTKYSFILYFFSDITVTYKCQVTLIRLVSTMSFNCETMPNNNTG